MEWGYFFGSYFLNYLNFSIENLKICGWLYKRAVSMYGPVIISEQIAILKLQSHFQACAEYVFLFNCPIKKKKTKESVRTTDQK